MSYYQRADDIVGYTWGEGAIVCPTHTPAEYRQDGATAANGNPVTPVFANEAQDDDVCDHTLYPLGDCA